MVRWFRQYHDQFGFPSGSGEMSILDYHRLWCQAQKPQLTVEQAALKLFEGGSALVVENTKKLNLGRTIDDAAARNLANMLKCTHPHYVLYQMHNGNLGTADRLAANLVPYPEERVLHRLAGLSEDIVEVILATWRQLREKLGDYANSIPASKRHPAEDAAIAKMVGQLLEWRVAPANREVELVANEVWLIKNVAPLLAPAGLKGNKAVRRARELIPEAVERLSEAEEAELEIREEIEAAEETARRAAEEAAATVIQPLTEDEEKVIKLAATDEEAALDLIFELGLNGERPGAEVLTELRSHIRAIAEAEAAKPAKVITPVVEPLTEAECRVVAAYDPDKPARALRLLSQATGKKDRGELETALQELLDRAKALEAVEEPVETPKEEVAETRESVVEAILKRLEADLLELIEDGERDAAVELLQSEGLTVSEAQAAGQGLYEQLIEGIWPSVVKLADWDKIFAALFTQGVPKDEIPELVERALAGQPPFGEVETTTEEAPPEPVEAAVEEPAVEEPEEEGEPENGEPFLEETPPEALTGPFAGVEWPADLLEQIARHYPAGTDLRELLVEATEAGIATALKEGRENKLNNALQRAFREIQGVGGKTADKLVPLVYPIAKEIFRERIGPQHDGIEAEPGDEDDEVDDPLAGLDPKQRARIQRKLQKTKSRQGNK